MSLHVVTKAPLGLDGSAQMIGVYDDPVKARLACRGVGTYMIFQMDLNRTYRTGQLLDVSVHRVLGGPDTNI